MRTAIIAVLLLTAVIARSAEAEGLTIAAWDCGTFAGGTIAPVSVGQPLQGEGAAGTVAAVPGRTFLKVAHGQSVTTALERGPLAEGKPVAIDIEFVAEALPDAYHGGLVEAGSYNASGVRILFQQNRKISVEIFTAKEPVYLVSSDAIALNKLTTVRYEHDGKRARLLIDGKDVAQAVCPPAGMWSGKMRIGVASGPSYNFNGAIGKIRILALR